MVIVQSSGALMDGQYRDSDCSELNFHDAYLLLKY